MHSGMIPVLATSRVGEADRFGDGGRGISLKLGSCVQSIPILAWNNCIMANYPYDIYPKSCYL